MQSETPFEKRTVGAIAAALPGATAIFRAHKLDFCCGGDVVLDEAVKAKGIALDDIVRQLATLDPLAAALIPTAPEALIEHIIARYHDVHRRELPELIRLAKKVEARHVDHPKVPTGLAAVLEETYGELVAHMQKEEIILFPLMRKGGNEMIVYPIARMRDEHVEHGERLRHIATLTHDAEPPADACNSWLALYAGIRKLIDDLMQHIHLENNLLFPQFEAEQPSEHDCGCAH